MPQPSNAEWNQFVDDYAKRMKSFAYYAYCHNWADADDLVGAAFVRAIGSNGPDDIARLKSWFYVILRNVAIDSKRNPRESRGGGDDGSDLMNLLPSKGLGPEDECVAKEADDELLRLLKGGMALLNTDEREALHLFHIDDVPLGEVATIIGRSYEATRNLVSRARRKLREGLER